MLNAVQAVLIGVVATETGRDTKASLARNLKMSSAEAAKAAAVADVVNRLPEAENALADGRVTADQLHKLAAVQNDDEAARLLRDGADNNDTPDEFARRVQKHRVESEGPSLRDKQRVSRGVWFSNTDNGCIAIRGVLPPLEGTQLKAALDEHVNRHYRAKHPERAQNSGDHHEEPRSRRLADALHALVTGWQTAGNSNSNFSVSGSSAGDPPGTATKGAGNRGDGTSGESGGCDAATRTRGTEHEPNNDGGIRSNSETSDTARAAPAPTGGRTAVIVTVKPRLSKPRYLATDHLYSRRAQHHQASARRPLRRHPRHQRRRNQFR